MWEEEGVSEIMTNFFNNCHFYGGYWGRRKSLLLAGYLGETPAGEEVPFIKRTTTCEEFAVPENSLSQKSFLLY